MTDRKHTSISDAEETRIQKMIASDPDAPEATDEQMAEAGPVHEGLPGPGRNHAQECRWAVGGRR